MNDINDEFHKSFEWKGEELQPFSEARRAVASSAGVRMFGDAPPSLLDMHILLYILIAPRKELAKAHRNPDAFIEKVMEWADKNITPADYEEEAAMIKGVLENAFSTQATVIDNGSGDTSGN
jgi:hypothetical protein